MLRTVYYSIQLPLFLVIVAHVHTVVPRPFPPPLSKGLGMRLAIVVLSIDFKIAEFHGFSLHPLGLVTFAMKILRNRLVS